MLLQKLQKAQVIHPPKWLVDNTQYLTIMGSNAYGVSSDNSDFDIYGFTIPPKDDIFPHLRGEINGFGRQVQRFDQWQEHHIKSLDSTTEYDFSVYNIIRFFHLCMENNPNMVDSLFTPLRCVLHSTQIGEQVRGNREMFLHKGCWPKFKGYAYAQLHKIRNKSNASNPKRQEMIQKVGYDVKFAYHVLRLLNEVEQILVEHTLDLEKNREQLKSIRRGEWTLAQIEEFFTRKEKDLEYVYLNSTLPQGPDEKKIKQLLLICLEIHYGSLDNAIKKDVDVQMILRELESIIEKYK